MGLFVGQKNLNSSRMVNYKWISDFHMSMEASGQDASMHCMTGGLIIKFHLLICILYDMRDIYVGWPLISELLQTYQK